MFLQWTQWLHCSALAGAPVVVINVDETAVERLVPHRRGHVLSASAHSVVTGRLYERIARRDSHGHVTLVGVACEDEGLQPHMPQLILAKAASLTRVEADRLRRLEAPLAWVPDTSGWVTADNFPGILTRLRRAILQHRPGSQIVLVLDSASQHVADAVVLHAQRLRVHLVCVPGRLTWLLQPLDTHVYGTLKHRLHQAQLAERSASPTGVLPAARWIDILERVVRDVLVGGRFRDAMQANGLMGSTAMLRRRVGETLLGHLPLPLVPPTDADLTAILGRGRIGLAERLTRGAERYRRARVAGALPAAHAPALALPPA